MVLLGDLLRFFRRLVSRARRDRLDDELGGEIAGHIERRRQQLVDAGMDPHDAAREARRIFGNVTAIREETREMWTFTSLETVLQDARFGARLLRRSPLFTVAAVASLAIGIGAATAVFSLADGLLLRQLPVRNPQELVLFRWISGPDGPFESLTGYGNQTATESSSTSFSLSAYRTVQENLRSEADVFAFADLYTVNLAVNGRPQSGSGQVVSGNYFSVLGIDAAAGRLLSPSDDAPGASPTAVIGHDFWQRAFAGDPHIVGRTVVVNGTSFEIAGVLPAGFSGANQVGQPCDVMVPMVHYKVASRAEDDPLNPNFWWVLMMARLKPGVTAERVQSASDLLLKGTVRAAMPDMPAENLPRMSVEPGAQGQTEDRRSMREPIRIMGIVVTIVLLVACANVANLLLARGRARAREVAVRAAIGAPRGRIVRQLLTEGLLLGLAASAIGLTLAQWISSALLPALAPNDQMFTVRYALDVKVVSFTTTLGIACSVLFALFPAIRASKAGLTPALQEGSRGATGSPARFAAAGALVVVQVALSMLLLSAATLLGWSAYRLQRVDPGFDPTNVLTFSVDTTSNGYDSTRRRAYVARALEALRTIPGVTHASMTSHRLIANSSWSGASRADDMPPLAPDDPATGDRARKYRTWRLAVDETFFDTFGIPLLRGRPFSSHVSPTGPGVVVVNEALARLLFGTTDVVGRHMVPSLGQAEPLEIVGVARDAHYTSLRTPPPPTAYLPYQQAGSGRTSFAVKTGGHPLALAETVRETMRRLDASLPLFGVITQEGQIRRSLAQERLFANLALLLGGVTLALCGIGLYGLLAYAVTRRTPEIGVRIALGAERRQVRWMILRQSMVLVVAGLVVGVPAAYAFAGFVESLLFGLSPYDPRALAAGASIMLLVAVVAAYIPARRASRIDPLAALRAD